MFVAQKIKDGTRVTSIGSEWDGTEDQLRELAASGELVCPGCKQSLWLRTGTTRRRHFAHRSLADCPLEHQSQEVLEIKALMFRWLQTKYPGKVHLEIPVGGPGFDKPLDIVVQAEPRRKFGYWVLDRQERDREIMLGYRGLKDFFLHFIHTAKTLNLQDANSLLLTASQRDFMEISEFDSSIAWEGHGHLHFINAEDSSLSIYRGLYCMHRPNVFGYSVRRTGLLDLARISPRTGEIVFAEDVEAREQWRQCQRANPAPPSPDPQPQAVTVPVVPDKKLVGTVSGTLLPKSLDSQSIHFPGVYPPIPQAESAPEKPTFNINGPFRCEVCGVMTTDWSQAKPSEGTCKCRSCVLSGRPKANSGSG